MLTGWLPLHASKPAPPYMRAGKAIIPVRPLTRLALVGFAASALSVALPPASFAQIDTPTSTSLCDLPDQRGTAAYEKYCGSGASAQTGGGDTAQQQMLLNGASNIGYALGSAFARWLFSPGASQAQRQRQAYMQELQHQREEAERQHNIEVEQRLEAMIAGLTATMKLHGLPDLQLKSAGAGGELELKTTDQSQGYGIAGLPGLYTGGPRGGSQPQEQGLSLKVGDGSTADQGYGISGLPGLYTGGPRSGPQPAQETPNSQSGKPSTGQRSVTNVDFTKISPEQAVQLAKALGALPPDEQQKILEAAQGSPSANAPGTGSALSDEATALPGSQSSNRPGGAAPPTLLTNVESDSLRASGASAPEEASAGARAGFDVPAGGSVDFTNSSHSNPIVDLAVQSHAGGAGADQISGQLAPAGSEQGRPGNDDLRAGGGPAATSVGMDFRRSGGTSAPSRGMDLVSADAGAKPTAADCGSQLGFGDHTIVDSCHVPSGLPKTMEDEIPHTPAGDRVHEGFEAIAHHDWTAAVACFEDAHNKEPGNAGIVRLLDLARYTQAREQESKTGTTAQARIDATESAEVNAVIDHQMGEDQSRQGTKGDEDTESSVVNAVIDEQRESDEIDALIDEGLNQDLARALAAYDRLHNPAAAASSANWGAFFDALFGSARLSKRPTSGSGVRD